MPQTKTQPRPHYHLETDTMDGLGTFATKAEASEHVTGGWDAYTAHQMKGGARVSQPCSCWMGEYLINRWAERAR